MTWAAQFQEFAEFSAPAMSAMRFFLFSACDGHTNSIAFVFLVILGRRVKQDAKGIWVDRFDLPAGNLFALRALSERFLWLRPKAGAAAAGPNLISRNFGIHGAPRVKAAIMIAFGSSIEDLHGTSVIASRQQLSPDAPNSLGRNAASF
jgi:hypothetical protein